MSGFPRRPSSTTITSAGSSSHHEYATGYPLSTLEDSCNVNNRGMAFSSSQHNSQRQQQLHPDNCSAVHSGANNAYNSSNPKGNSQTQQQQSSQRNNAEDNNDGVEVMIEEKRKRADGNGYSSHRYTRGRLLGKGGFAKVYLCTAMDTGKNYAVKVVPKANLVKARARQKVRKIDWTDRSLGRMFCLPSFFFFCYSHTHDSFPQLQAEIKIHRALKHKHVCQYKHYFEDRNNCYILLELCHNQSLNEMIKRRKRLTEPEAAYFMRQLLEATRYMHDQNVIHRDLKLGNLFLDKDMNIKVGDLGLATRVEDKDEKRKTICGTPNYIAPEIIQGDKAKRGHSFEVDVWSMGVILYTVLIGKPPYEAKDVKATYQRILNNEYSFPRNIEVSNSAKNLIMSMLQSKPSDRPTLDQIELHPFLTETHIPSLLPTSVLSVAPIWRIDEYGEVSVDDGQSAVAKKLGLKRAPFGSHDPNKQTKNPPSSSVASSSSHGGGRKKDNSLVNMDRVVKTALASFTGNTSATAQSSRKYGQQSAPGFAIYDEAEKMTTFTREAQSMSRMREYRSDDFGASRSDFSEPPLYESSKTYGRQKPPYSLTEETLLQQTRALSLSDQVPLQRYTSAASSVVTQGTGTTSVFSNSDNDAEMLQSMADHLDAVINITESHRGSYRSIPLRPLSPRHGPFKWVTRYVDYTSKYGLGFLLNDGSSGVYFNDSTKTALQSNGEMFQYIERKKLFGPDDMSRRRGETVVETHNLQNYPESLKKKVTLLKHFRNYLLEQEKNEGCVQENLFGKRDDHHNMASSSDLVYVKKWVRTKHAILFLLSIKTVQVIFYDQTEILLTPDVTFLTYVDKNRRRATYNFTDELVGSSAEIEKRLKYTKEIILQLLSGSNRN